MELTVRNVDLNELAETLGEQQARKIDLVVPATALHAEAGNVRLEGAEITFDDNGVNDPNVTYRPTDVFQEHIASKLDMGLRYTRRMAAERPDLWDANVNGWIHGASSDGFDETRPADDRSFLFRGYSGAQADGTDNVARALLSDRYLPIDNYDVLLTTLKAIAETDDGTIKVAGADLSDKRMYVRFTSATVAVNAAGLLNGYRNPFASGTETRVGAGGWTVDEARVAAAAERMGYKPGEEPMIWAGFELSNSELGFGQFTITPRAQFQICRNGLKITADADKRVHLGGRMDEGRVQWSEDTQRKELALVYAKTRDSVQAFLSADYWTDKVAELTEKAGKPVADAPKTIKAISKRLLFSDTEADSILRHFVLGGQPFAAGLMNAVTSTAQTVADADRAAELEGRAVEVLDLV